VALAYRQQQPEERDEHLRVPSQAHKRLLDQLPELILPVAQPVDVNTACGVPCAMLSAACTNTRPAADGYRTHQRRTRGRPFDSESTAAFLSRAPPEPPTSAWGPARADKAHRVRRGQAPLEQTTLTVPLVPLHSWHPSAAIVRSAQTAATIGCAQSVYSVSTHTGQCGHSLATEVLRTVS
jgi:hypothetical protein